MDEKIKRELLIIGRRFATRYFNVQSIPHQHRSENTFAKEVEQAFRDDGWIEPQQPAEGELVDNSLKQGITDILKEVINDTCFDDDNPDCMKCGKVDCILLKEKASKILALLGPAEGELVNNPYKDKPVEEPCGDCWNEAFNEGSEAQLAHMIQQGYRKLPSEDEFEELSHKAVEKMLKLHGTPYQTSVAHELLRLLKERSHE